MKNILIIGSTGQIGSELTMKLRGIYGGACTENTLERHHVPAGLNQSFSDGVENTTSPVYTSSQKVFNSS